MRPTSGAEPRCELGNVACFKLGCARPVSSCMDHGAWGDQAAPCCSKAACRRFSSSALHAEGVANRAA